MSGNATVAIPGPGASIEIHQTQASFIGSVSWGSGTLTYLGMRYPIRARGLGIGVTRTSAMGEVYGLRQLTDFSDLYGQARSGAVLGDRQAIRAI